MHTPMIFVLGAWLDTKCVELELPVMLMDDLNETGECLCLSQTSTETTLKEYVNGSRVRRLEFNIYAQGQIEKKADLIGYLTKLVYLFESLRDFPIDNGHLILRSSATAPTIANRTENDTVRYAISVTLSYKENDNA